MAINIGDYKTNARESGIMVGDYVQITRKAEDGENGWNSARWTLHMDKTIGETGQVRVITDRWNFVIKFDNGDFGNYPYFVLRRVHRSPIVPRFTIGDRVLVKRAWKYGEYGACMYFDNNKMTETIGKIGEIVEVCLHKRTHGIYYCAKFENMNGYAYPEFVLKKIDKPNPDFEFEPFDTLLHITGPTLSR